jgi:hypothetical protein
MFGHQSLANVAINGLTLLFWQARNANLSAMVDDMLLQQASLRRELEASSLQSPVRSPAGSTGCGEPPAAISTAVPVVVPDSTPDATARASDEGTGPQRRTPEERDALNKANNRRLAVLCRRLQSPASYAKAIQELTVWCKSKRAFAVATRTCLFACLISVSRCVGRPEFEHKLGKALFKVCARYLDHMDPELRALVQAAQQAFSQLPTPSSAPAGAPLFSAPATVPSPAAAAAPATMPLLTTLMPMPFMPPALSGMHPVPGWPSVVLPTSSAVPIAPAHVQPGSKVSRVQGSGGWVASSPQIAAMGYADLRVVWSGQHVAGPI